MGERIEAFRAEMLEQQKSKLLNTIDQNMDFHEWMEKHRKFGSTTSDGGIENELEQAELIKLGDECGIPHPFACRSSPFFNNHTKENILEVQNVTPDIRPFSDLKNLNLVDVNEEK